MMSRTSAMFAVITTLMVLAPWGSITAAEPAATQATPGDKILGEWLTEAKNAKVTVAREKGRYIGRITWLREANGSDGRPVKDAKNPDAALRERPVLGTAILWDMEWTGEEWEHGKIYDPDSGKSYSVQAKLASARELELRGFVGISLFGRTEKWTRP